MFESFTGTNDTVKTWSATVSHLSICRRIIFAYEVTPLSSDLILNMLEETLQSELLQLSI